MVKEHKEIDSELAYITRVLKVARIRDNYQVIGDQARAQNWSHEEYLATVLSVESYARWESGANARVKKGGILTPENY